MSVKITKRSSDGDDGKKQCPECRQQVASGLHICPKCGLNFVKWNKKFRKPKKNRGRKRIKTPRPAGRLRTIVAPAGSCPIPLQNTDYESVRFWCEAVQEHAKEKGEFYTSTALKHFAKQFVDAFDPDFDKVMEQIQDLENGVEHVDPIAAAGGFTDQWDNDYDVRHGSQQEFWEGGHAIGYHTIHGTPAYQSYPYRYQDDDDGADVMDRYKTGDEREEEYIEDTGPINISFNEAKKASKKDRKW